MINYQYYTLFDKPIPYKNISLHPIKLKDFFEFSNYTQCYMLEKNSIKDNPELAIKAIQMNYFEFLYEFSMSTEDNLYILLFDGLLRLALNNASVDLGYGIGNEGKPFFRIDKELYDSNDFDEIKKIIVEQNMIELPDIKIQKAVRDKLEEARRFREKINKNKIASLEEQVIALSIYSGHDIESIFDMSYRKFILAIKRANHMIMSNIYLTASMSGMTTFKDKSVLKGWLADLDSEKNNDVTMKLSEVQGKLNSASAEK